MRKSAALVYVSLAALALSACDSGPQEADTNQPTMSGTPAPAAAAPAGEAEGDAETLPAGEETPAAADGDTATAATPTPTPSAARSTAAAAPAGPPQAFTTCAVCHSVQPGQNIIGPSLAGVFGRRAGSVAGANYSPAMRESGLTWNAANLDRYLADPNGTVAGTLMPPPGLSTADRQAVVAYLRTL